MVCLITFGWWRAEVVKHLGRFSHRLIILRAVACIFLMAVSGIGSTAQQSGRRGPDTVCRSTACTPPLFTPGLRFYWKPVMNRLPDSWVFDFSDKVWTCPRNLVGPDAIVVPEPTWNDADPIILFPSKTSDMHFEGFSVRSRSWQESEIDRLMMKRW
jgi:hypothetical protein